MARRRKSKSNAFVVIVFVLFMSFILYTLYNFDNKGNNSDSAPKTNASTKSEKNKSSNVKSQSKEEKEVKENKEEKTSESKEEKKETKSTKKNNTVSRIELVGEENVTIKQGEKYKDPGAKAYNTDNEDISELIETSNNLDTSKKGDYAITYSIGKYEVIRFITVE